MIELTNSKKTIPKVQSLCASDHFKILVIRSVNLSRYFSNPRITRPNQFLLVKCSSFPKRDDKYGTMVNEDKSENNVAIITVTQNCVIILLTRPVLTAMGRNTTTITRVIAVTVNPISLVPS